MKKFIKSRKMWFAFITVFISGVVIGVVAGVGGSIYVGMKIHRPEFIRSRLLGHMTKELDLTDKQKAEAEKIMAEMSKQLGDVRKEQYPKIKNIISTAFTDIERILDEEQKVKFKDMREKMKKWHHSRHGHKKREDKGHPSPPRDDKQSNPSDKDIKIPGNNKNVEVQVTP